MGYLGPENPLLDLLGMEQDGRSNADAAYDHYHTNVDGIFAAGDARCGATCEADRWLMGKTDLL